MTQCYGVGYPWGGEGNYLEGSSNLEAGTCIPCLSGEDSQGGVPAHHYKKNCKGRTPGQILTCEDCWDGNWRKGCQTMSEGAVPRVMVDSGMGAQAARKVFANHALCAKQMSFRCSHVS